MIKDRLKAVWNKREKDVMFHFPLGVLTKSDAHWLSGIFNKQFTQELESRGYDITTLRFEIKVGDNRPDKFESIMKQKQK